MLGRCDVEPSMLVLVVGRLKGTMRKVRGGAEASGEPGAGHPKITCLYYLYTFLHFVDPHVGYGLTVDIFEGAAYIK
jgi:hypothetical protein